VSSTENLGDSMRATLRTAFLDKVLDPISSFGEIIFGLIMTLTFTLGAGIMLEQEGPEAARELLIATIGCNIAWGLIDAAMFLVTQILEKGRRRRLLHIIQRAPSAERALPHVAEELDDMLSPVTTEPERRVLYKRIADRVRAGAIPRTRITKTDLYGALASFWLVFLASVPAALPFLFIEPPWLALRVSNLLLLAMLFGVGWTWAGYTLARAWAVGLSLMLGGLMLVALAIVLGG
jgi:hypothetical protein